MLFLAFLLIPLKHENDVFLWQVGSNKVSKGTTQNWFFINWFVLCRHHPGSSLEKTKTSLWKRLGTKTELEMSGKKSQIKTLKDLLESLKNYRFKNDKKVWLLGSKILKNKQCLKSFCTVLYNASVVARHMPAGFVGWFEPELFQSSRKRNIKLKKWNSKE